MDFVFMTDHDADCLWHKVGRHVGQFASHEAMLCVGGHEPNESGTFLPQAFGTPQDGQANGWDQTSCKQISKGSNKQPTSNSAWFY